MNVHCNAGICSMDLVGELPGYGTVWYDPDTIANILSLKRVQKKYTVEYSVRRGGDGDVSEFIVTKPNGTVFTIQESDDGLYHLDTSMSGSILVNTGVAGNCSEYTNADYVRATKAKSYR